MKNNFRKLKMKYVTDSRTYKLMTTIDPDNYWDEGWNYHKSRGRFKWKVKQILQYQVRQYRSWKYNRRTHWK